MYTSNKVVALVFAFSVHGIVFAQNKLNINDKLPDLELKNVLNYKSNKLKLADFKGKYLIIDFWNQKCLPCFTAFPKLDSLQKIFKNDLQILLVNKESLNETIKFFKKRKNVKMPNIPLITNDTLLLSKFPLNGYPYHVWIDKEGIINYISGGYNTNFKNVGNFISGENLSLFNTTVSKQVGSAFEKMTNAKFKYYSSLSYCNRLLNIGSPSGEIRDNGNSIRLAVNCKSILQLLITAFGEGGKFNFSPTYSYSLEVDSIIKFVRPEDKSLLDVWLNSHAYNYELYLPISKANDRYKIMQEDLNRIFDLDAHIINKKVKSIVLKKSSDIKKIQTRGGKPLDEFEELQYGINNKNILQLKNQPFSILVDYFLKWFNYDYPFFNEMTFDGNVDIIIHKSSVDPLSLELLNKDIEPYGLRLEIEEREIPFLVIKNR